MKLTLYLRSQTHRLHFIICCMLFFILAAGIQTANGQNTTLKGFVKDTINKTYPQYVIVSLLRPSDSTLLNYAMSNEKGYFELTHLAEGEVLLLITHPGYADFKENIVLKAGTVTNLDTISLTQKARLLKEVLVKAQAAMRMKGDTVEYLADKIAVRPNATVEDLLKRLPGISVDRNGEITAQGKKVEQVLVDGEEFFGWDPTKTVQTLRSDLVDKVQVFDKKSKNEELTGIDDGNRKKTINLEIKKDKKKSYFGHLGVGYGTKEMYQSEANITFLNGTQHLVVTASADNNNGNFGNKLNSSGSEGIPKNLNLSANYQNSLKGLGVMFGTANVSQRSKTTGSQTVSRQLLADSVLNTNGTQSGNNVTTSESFSTMVMKNNLTKGNLLMFNMSANNSLQVSESTTTGKTFSSTQRPINESFGNTHSNGKNTSASLSLTYMKRLNKKQSLIFSLNGNFNQNNSDNYFYSKNKFYNSVGVINRSDSVDQYKRNENKNSTLGSTLAYNVSLITPLTLTLSSGFGANENKSTVNAFNKDASGVYSLASNDYSNLYVYSTLSQSNNATLTWNKKKINATVNMNFNPTTARQTNKINDSLLLRHYIDWNPSSSFNLKFTPSKVLSLRYSGRTRQPSLDQLQPIKTNENPLNIIGGNSALKPSFSNDFTFDFMNNNILQEKSFSTNVTYSTTSEAITNYEEIKPDGTRFSYPVNVNGNHSVSLMMSYGFRIPKTLLSFTVNGNSSFSHTVNFINSLKNANDNTTLSLGLSSRYKKTAQVFTFSANISHTETKSSINKEQTYNYWTYYFDSSVDLDLPWKWVLSNDVGMNFRDKINATDKSQNEVVWNMFVKRDLDKKNKFSIKFIAYDILNQHIGFSRNVSNSYYSERTYDTLSQYFMCSVIWNFTKKAAAAPEKQPNIQ
jgi:hypothetical protein